LVRQNNYSIRWTKARCTSATPDALGNAASDRIAARGCTGSSSRQLAAPPKPRRQGHTTSYPTPPNWSTGITRRTQRWLASRPSRSDPMYISPTSRLSSERSSIKLRTFFVVVHCFLSPDPALPAPPGGGSGVLGRRSWELSLLVEPRGVHSLGAIFPLGLGTCQLIHGE